MGFLKILESLVNSEVEELDLEMLAMLSKKMICWRRAVCGCPFLWDPWPQTTFGSVGIYGLIPELG